jgi:hypothetical protein
MKEDITILKVIIFIILGLFSILLIGTHVRINEYENELAEIRNEINIVKE